MKNKKSNYKPNYRLISAGFFASTTCWFVVDNFIVPISIGKYVVVEIVMGVMGALYEFEKKRLNKKDIFKSNRQH